MKRIRLTIDDQAWDRIAAAGQRKGLSPHEYIGRIVGEHIDSSDGLRTTVKPGDDEATIT